MVVVQEYLLKEGNKYQNKIFYIVADIILLSIKNIPTNLLFKKLD